MMLGRFLLGVGSECFIVAATTVVGRWFKGKEISFALALQLLVGGSARGPPTSRPTSRSRSSTLAAAASPRGRPRRRLARLRVLYAGLEKRAARVYAVKKAGATDKLVLSDLVRFDLGYWWVVGLCVAFYSTIFPFRTFANLYFIEAKGLSPEDAGNLKSILPLLSMIGMPLFGLSSTRSASGRS
jgi:hypothetical protein